MDLRFRKNVSLLLRILPEISREKDFALHGGSAINLFYHDMPRLSVDIDLTFIPFGSREDDLAQIMHGLNAIRIRLMRTIPSLIVKAPEEAGDDLKLHCYISGAQVKVEVNTIIRGVTEKVTVKPLCAKAQNTFDSFCEIQVVPEGQLFGGKIVAALDRQHPRDLFDVRKMLENTKYSEKIHHGFLFCLLNGRRPFHEILQPVFKDQKSVLISQFSGMTDEVFTYKMFEATRNDLVGLINLKLKPEEKTLLKSFAEGSPEWGIVDYSNFPGVKWKLMNIIKLKATNNRKFSMQLRQLEKVLDS
jgi:predicted nucleotidyltransferase component of viral defense system